ncbi:MAG: imidazole glycerol phosphate synthase subunit HisF, partial [Sphingobacteriales bacterium]
MLRSRITPCLLVHNKGLVKTVGFKHPKYVGDPINAVKIFNEKEVDELIVLDIDASVQGRGPDFELIRNLAMECRMPFCYGGGVTNVEQAKKIINLGAEKVALSSAVIQNFDILQQIGLSVGIQSVVVVLDVKKTNLDGGYEIFIHNGKKATGIKVKEFVKRLDKLDRIEDVELERPNMRINFTVEKQPGRTICTLKHITKSFKDVKIVEDTGAEIDRGDKIALIGANGKGKSTL